MTKIRLDLSDETIAALKADARSMGCSLNEAAEHVLAIILAQREPEVVAARKREAEVVSEFAELLRPDKMLARMPGLPITLRDGGME